MIDENSLNAYANLFKDERQLEKDYLINLMLKTISINKVSQDLEFKGGTALYLFHGLDRFSEDLDFDYIGKAREISSGIDSMIEPVIKDFSLSYRISKSKGNIIVRDKNKNIIGIRSEFFIEGPLFGKTGRRHKIKLDISTREDVLMKPESVTLVSRYGDIGTILLYKMPLQEMLAEKLCAITERSKARDLYDAYFILKYKGLKYDNATTSKKFEKRNRTFSRELLARAIDEISENLWKEELQYIVPKIPDLNEVKEFIKNAIKGNAAIS
jgi:predicted nucleotidyltransferase component of viral defense system